MPKIDWSIVAAWMCILALAIIVYGTIASAAAYLLGGLS